MKLRLADSLIEVLSPAKVNFFLEIHGKRADGFHELETVMTTVSLFDQIRFRPRSDDQILIEIDSNSTDSNSTDSELTNQADQKTGSTIPTDDRNLIIQALKKLRTEFNLGDLPGCDVLLKKRIPSEAGLGGASSNAAATLLAGCRMWDLQLDRTARSRLARIAADIGSDVPFFLFGGTAVCRGRGEIITPINSPVGISIVIAKPETGLSTANVFSNVKVTQERQSSDALNTSVKNGNVVELSRSMFNRLECAAEELTDNIAEIRREFERVNCLGHQMSGSGTSYFGVFSTRRAARIAARTLSGRLPKAKINQVHTLSPTLKTSA